MILRSGGSNLHFEDCDQVDKDCDEFEECGVVICNQVREDCDDFEDCEVVICNQVREDCDDFEERG